MDAENIFEEVSQPLAGGTMLNIGRSRSETSSNYLGEKDSLLKCFDSWPESDQVEFVEQLLQRMCHYQHGHINSFLQPMLQRDFISLLPSRLFCSSTVPYLTN